MSRRAPMSRRLAVREALHNVLLVSLSGALVLIMLATLGLFARMAWWAITIGWSLL